MYYVYFLFSLKDKNYYVGYTSKLAWRYKQHQAGKVVSTAYRRPLKLVYYEAYINQSNAKRRELFYKSGRGRETIRKILKETLEKLS